MTPSAYLIKASGECEIIIPANHKKFTLEELQKYVGGYIEYIQLPHRELLVVNEEGRLRNLPPNQAASMACGRHIVGDVVYGPSKLL